VRYSLLLLCVVSFAGCIVQPHKPVTPPKPEVHSAIAQTAKASVVNYVELTATNLNQVADDIEAGRIKKASELAGALKPSEQAKAQMFDALYQEWNREFAEDFTKAPQALRETAKGLREAIR
jgi:hypothetical protein